MPLGCAVCLRTISGQQPAPPVHIATSQISNRLFLPNSPKSINAEPICQLSLPPKLLSSPPPPLPFFLIQTKLDLMAPSSFNIRTALVLSLVIVFHQSPTVTCDLLSPLLSPIFENVCKKVSCGKGSCRPTQNSTVPFECVCEPGWKQPLSVHGFSFLPCVLPNCTIDYSCSQAASPPTAPKNTTKGSIFDPCNWDICAGGTCKRSSSNSSYSCSCSEGYDNLMNTTSLPCFRECALGGDCKQLGITLFNGSAAPAPALNANDTTSKGRSFQHEKFSWVIILAMFGPMVALA